jgi:hypothetical protein
MRGAKESENMDHKTLVAYMRTRNLRLAGTDEPGWYYPGPDGARHWVTDL